MSNIFTYVQVVTATTDVQNILEKIPDPATDEIHNWRILDQMT